MSDEVKNLASKISFISFLSIEFTSEVRAMCEVNRCERLKPASLVLDEIIFRRFLNYFVILRCVTLCDLSEYGPRNGRI